MKAMQMSVQRGRTLWIAVLSLLLIVGSTSLAKTVKAAGIFDNVPAKLVPIFAKYRILPSKDIQVTIVDGKKSKGQVAVKINFNIDNAKSVVLLVAENKNPLTAVFKVNHNSINELQTNIRIDKSSHVIALIDTGGQLYGNFVDVNVD